MTRAEHLTWCRERAIREMDYEHDPWQGVVSLISDLRKHPETAASVQSTFELAIALKQIGQLVTRQQVVNFLKDVQ